MKVLFVHELFGDLGGAESTVRRLGQGLQSRGLELGFLYGELTHKGHEEFSELFPERWCWGHGQLSAALRWSPDVLFVHKLDDLFLLERLVESRLPLVRMVHDHDIYCLRRHRYFPWNRKICTRPAGWACGALCGVLKNERGPLPVRLASPARKLQEIELCKRFHHHITVSDYLKQQLVLNDFDPSSITTLWPAVPRAHPEHRATYREPLVAFSGQILRGKGVDVLIEALPLLKTPGWRCSIVGDGSFREHCQDLVARYGLQERVELPGWVPQRELRNLWKNARVGVVPSVWPEPLGAVGIEMIQHGLPVVGFDVGGVGEWLHDGVNGYRVPPFDRKSLADRLDRLLSDPHLASRMGERGRQLARDWCNPDEHFAQVIDILQNVVKRPSGITQPAEGHLSLA